MINLPKKNDKVEIRLEKLCELEESDKECLTKLIKEHIRDNAELNQSNLLKLYNIRRDAISYTHIPLHRDYCEKINIAFKKLGFNLIDVDKPKKETAEQIFQIYEKGVSQNKIRDAVYAFGVIDVDKCAICGMPLGRAVWNGKDLWGRIDHINGDCSNNTIENLRCVCPNCDTQLDTCGSRNTWYKKNHVKNNRGIKRNVGNRPVIDLSTMIIYDNLYKCSKSTNKAQSTVNGHCLSKVKKVRFMYLDDYNLMNGEVNG